MKHIKLFETWESKYLSEEDIQTIENCFLEYIDDGRCKTTTNMKGYYGEPLKALGFFFEIPRYVGDFNSWAKDLREELSGDIKRCESYGYSCQIFDPSFNPKLFDSEFILEVKKKK